VIDPKTIRPGNWLLYRPENQYCTVISVGAYIAIRDFKAPKNCFPDDLSPISINHKDPTTYGFSVGWTKQSSSGLYLSLSFADNLPVLVSPDGEILPARFVHQLQNAYFRFTGEELTPTLFGSPSQ
jgi:hypothetical protein